ncbi:MAG: hypothetical protein OXG04_19170 [Acidobacteria bacterium]|nr:hypothetical protein [Acidobacteriota bacterium]
MERVFGCSVWGNTRDRLLAGLRRIACTEQRKWIEVGESNNDGELVEVMRDGLDRLSPGQQPVDENGGDGTVFGCLLTPGDKHRMVEGLRAVAVADVRKWVEVGEANGDAKLVEVMRDALERLSPGS